MKLSKEQSDIIYGIKAFCILGVVCAHTSANVAGGFIAERLSCFLNGMGCIGVPIFFFLSGVLFLNREQSLFVFFKKKMGSLFLPWLLTGTIVWLYVVLRKGGISLIAWANYVLGNGSYLYYMSMLLICYLIFWGKRFKIVRVAIFGGCSLLWLILECFDIVNTSNPYINPLNWIVYFAVGMLIAQFDMFEKLLEVVRRFKYVLISLWSIFTLVIVLLDISLTYWHQTYLVYELLSFGMLLVLAGATKESLLIKEIGKQSFAIYLLHMLFAGAVNTFFAQFGIEILLVLKPLIVIALVMLGIKVMKFIDKNAKLKGKLTSCFGVR